MSDKLTAEDLAELRAALEFRTPGVWRKGPHGGEIHVHADDPDIDPEWREKFGNEDTADFYAGDLVAESVGRDADVALIAGAPRWLAALLAEREELLAEILGLRRRLSDAPP